MLRTFPVLTGSRYKVGEIFKDATSKQDVVNCPACDFLQEPSRIGLMDCIECGWTFEAVLPEIGA